MQPTDEELVAGQSVYTWLPRIMIWGRYVSEIAGAFFPKRIMP